MDYLTTALAMFLSRPLAYIGSGLIAMCLLAGSYALCKILLRIIGIGQEGLVIKSIWSWYNEDGTSRGVISFDPASRDYRAPDVVRRYRG